MSATRWEGVATALSSVVHGGQVLGTVTYLRRERFLLPGGRMEEIPVISGNSWRGLLRDLAADKWWRAAGEPRLTLPMMHALWSGGSLAKVSGPTLTGSRLASLRQACPVISVFGAAGGGRIVDGCLQVGKMLPICRETAHLVPDRLLGPSEPPSFWDLTQVEYYSRLPGMPGQDLQGAEGEDEAAPARFGVETFLAGTRFYTWCSLNWASEQDRAFFSEVLAEYCEQARVGGMGRAGHGRLRLDLERSGTTTADKGWSPQVMGPSELLEVLAWLD